MTVNNGVSLLFLSVLVPKVYNTLNGLRGFAATEVAARAAAGFLLSFLPRGGN